MESERSLSSSSSSGSGSESGSESGGGSSSGSGSGSSSGNSSEAEEERLEPVTVQGRSLTLPQRLCETRAVFDEVVSARTWDSLEEADRERLRAFLPTFTEDDAAEKERTVRALFARETFHFSSPLDTFHTNLKQGNFRPDIAKMKRFLVKARRRQQKHKMRSYYAALLPELLIARERVLAAADSSPPGPPPRLPHTRRPHRPTHARAKLRYFEELAAIRGEVGGGDQPSEDENYPEGPPQQSRRQRRHLMAMQNAASTGVASTLGGVDPARPSSLDCLKHVLAAHCARRQRREIHPELNTSGITLEDIKQRVAHVNGAKKITFGGIKAETPTQKMKRSSKKENNTPKSAKVPADIKPIIKMPKGKDFEITDMDEMKPAVANVVIKRECVDTDSDNSSYIDPVESPKSNKRFKSSPVKTEIKQEVIDMKYLHKPSSSIVKELIISDTKIKQEIVDTVPFTAASITQPIPIKLEDLDGIDMMDLPVELADCEVSPPPPPPPPRATAQPDAALHETTHASFLSLVRALFPASSAHRASRRELRARASALMRSPIAPLNTWYSLSEDWCSELDSALEFLAGEKGPHPDDFVPYLTYIPETQMYQWIGAGRDCDAILGRLCERWLRARSAAGVPPAPPPRASPPPPPPPARITEPHPPSRSLLRLPPMLRRPRPGYPRPFPPHLPPSLMLQHPLHFRCATTWNVTPPTAAELVEFHSQERRRYSSAARPFTYVQHGYRAVVGPAGRGPANRASHAALLVPERPRHVSFVSLVKDAVARLPNGEGTRAHIMTLLKMSQYLSPCSEAALASAVSGALDRLHTVKRDPYLRYDQRTKLWIYLHRHKCEEDWERGGRNRGGAKTSSRAATSSREVKSAIPTPPPVLPHHQMEMEVMKMEEEEAGAGSDSDVDVDDSGPPAPPPAPPPPPPVAAAPQRPPAVRPSLPSQRPAQAHKTPQQARPAPTGRPQPSPHPRAAPTPPPPPPPPRAPPHVAHHHTTALPPLTAAVASVSAATVLPPRSSPMVQALPQKTAAPAVVKRSFALTQHHSVEPTHTMPLQLQVQTSSQLMSASSPTPPPPVQTVPLLVPAAASAAPAPATHSASAASAVHQQTLHVTQPKQINQAARSLLLKAPTSQATVSSMLCPGLVTSAQVSVGGRRGVVRVLSPATPTTGKSLISPRALLHQGNQALARRRAPIGQATVTVTTTAQMGTAVGMGGVMVSAAGGAGGGVGTRTVQLAGGRTVQLATNQTLHLPSGQAVQAVQLSSGHTLQLSSLGMAGRLPSGQPVSTQSVRTATHVRAPLVTHASAKGTIQLSGQNIQLAGLAGQVQLGHSVKLASGQSVQLGGQTLQTLQLAGGHTIQLSNGQTVQLGQSVGAPRSLVAAQQVVRPAAPGDKSAAGAQPLVAKLLTNSQGQVISVEGLMGAGRTLQLANVRQQAPKQLHTVQQGVGGVRVVGGRLSRPLLLAHKPLHNIILQQGESGTIRATSAAGTSSNQTIVLSNIGGQASGSVPTSTAPVLKLQQVSPLQQVKLAQGLKLQQAGGAGAAAGVRGVVMDGQQLKLVGGRHVLARLLRPAPPQ